MLKLAESELPVPITLTQLDVEPWLLNCQNGTLDLRTGELRRHDRDDLITRICPIAYDPGAHDDRWDLFVEQVMPDPEIRRYVQRALGYSITGTAEKGVMFLPYGPTHSGKTTLLETVKGALGSYAIATNVATLTGGKATIDGGRPRSDIVRLFGSRLAISTEVPAGVRLDEALVKALTGGDTITARTLYQTEVESRPTFAIWLGSNYRPAVRDDDDAIWNRVKQIPFEQQHDGSARDDSLKPYLETKARAAVLAWLVAGARAYVEEGLDAPDAVVSLTEDYRRDMNPLSAWIEECCELDPDAFSAYKDLRWSYEEFTRRGDKPVGSKRFTNSMKAIKGVTYGKDRVWRGIRIHTPEPEIDGEFARIAAQMDV
jgi:putative DNA primase/helicase